MTINKWAAFGLGVAAGVTAAVVIKTPAFQKACAAVAGKALLLKDEAAAFAESLKESAEDIAAEARYNAAHAADV